MMTRLPVLPTGRGWLFLGGALVSLGNALVTPNLASFSFCAAICAICAASLMLSFFSLRHLRIERRIGSDGVKGGSVSLPVEIVNEGRLSRQTMVLREGASFAETEFFDTVIPPLLSGESRLVQRRPAADRRGRHRLDSILALGGDPAGLFKRTRLFTLPDEVVVRPERLRLAWMPIRIRGRVQASSSGRNTGAAGFGQDFFGVREYRHSDGVRFIHWKASAKEGKLMVREFEEQNIPQVTIVLDNFAEEVGQDSIDSNFETLVKAAASMSDYLGGMYCRLAFVSGVPAGQEDAVKEIGFAFGLRRTLLDILTDITPGRSHLLESLDEAIGLTPPGSLIYILSMSSPEGMAARLETLRERDIETRWILAPKELFPYGGGAVDESDFKAPDGLLPHPLVCGAKSNLARILTNG